MLQSELYRVRCYKNYHQLIYGLDGIISTTTAEWHSTCLKIYYVRMSACRSVSKTPVRTEIAQIFYFLQERIENKSKSLKTPDGKVPEFDRHHPGLFWLDVSVQELIWRSEGCSSCNTTSRGSIPRFDDWLRTKTTETSNTLFRFKSQHGTPVN